MNNKKMVCTLLSILLSAALLLPAFEGSAAAAGAGDNAPRFSLKDLDGNEVYLSTFKGKPVFLNFWATWCPYCRKERKELDSLHDKYKDKDLIIISVSLDSSENKLRSFMEEHPADYIVLSDTEKKTAAMYAVRGYPTTFLIDRDGVIKQRFTGAREWSSKGPGNMIDELIK